jgi:hypothetical protein
MSDRTPRQDERKFHRCSREELNALAGEELPERPARSLVNANVAIPINATAAAELLADDTTACPDPAQVISIKALSREELNQLAGEELPERAAMSLVNANVAAPVNAPVAASVLSDNSIAWANPEQTADIDQSS